MGVASDVHHFLIALDSELERKLERLDNITFVLKRGIGLGLRQSRGGQGTDEGERPLH